MLKTAEKRDPAGEASPIGAKVSGNRTVAKYAPGIRIKNTEMTFCKNEM